MEKTTVSLEAILNRTNDWLKFAEAKNGALLAFNSAFFFGFLRILNNIETLPIFFKYYSFIIGGMLLIAIIINLLSFLPRLIPPWWIKIPNNTKEPNILYFGDICGLSTKTFLKRYYSVLGEKGEYSELDSLYAKQIIINSKISFIKYTQFNISSWFTLSVFLTPIGALLLSWMKDKS